MPDAPNRAAPAVPPVSPDTCPRCGGGFVCGAQGPGPCACTGLKLSAATLQSLQQQYKGCLCLRCLAEWAEPAPAGH